MSQSTVTEKRTVITSSSSGGGGYDSLEDIPYKANLGSRSSSNILSRSSMPLRHSTGGGGSSIVRTVEYGYGSMGGMGVGGYSNVSNTGVTSVKTNREREKKDLQDLNERFASYIEKVRFLEAQNRKLGTELDELRSKWGKETSHIKQMYEAELAEARRLIDDLSKDKAALEIKCSSIQEQNLDLQRQLDESKKYRQIDREQINKLNQQLADYESEINMLRRSLESLETERARDKATINKLQQDVDKLRMDLNNETLSHLDAENRRQTLEEEMEFMKKVHEQELKELAALAYRDTTAENREFWKSELGQAIRDIQQEYDAKVDQLRGEMEGFYNLKIQEFRTGATKQNMEVTHIKEENKKVTRQLTDLRGKLADLEARNAQLEKQYSDVLRELEAKDGDHMLEVTQLREEVSKLRSEMEGILTELQTLMDAKLSLELEICAYRKLLEGEENRVDWRSRASLIMYRDAYKPRSTFETQVKNKEQPIEPKMESMVSCDQARDVSPDTDAASEITMSDHDMSPKGDEGGNELAEVTSGYKGSSDEKEVDIVEISKHVDDSSLASPNKDDTNSKTDTPPVDHVVIVKEEVKKIENLSKDEMDSASATSPVNGTSTSQTETDESKTNTVEKMIEQDDPPIQKIEETDIDKQILQKKDTDKNEHVDQQDDEKSSEHNKSEEIQPTIEPTVESKVISLSEYMESEENEKETEAKSKQNESKEDAKSEPNEIGDDVASEINTTVDESVAIGAENTISTKDQASDDFKKDLQEQKSPDVGTVSQIDVTEAADTDKSNLESNGTAVEPVVSSEEPSKSPSMSTGNEIVSEDKSQETIGKLVEQTISAEVSKPKEESPIQSPNKAESVETVQKLVESTVSSELVYLESKLGEESASERGKIETNDIPYVKTPEEVIIKSVETELEQKTSEKIKEDVKEITPANNKSHAEVIETISADRSDSSAVWTEQSNLKEETDTSKSIPAEKLQDESKTDSKDMSLDIENSNNETVVSNKTPLNDHNKDTIKNESIEKTEDKVLETTVNTEVIEKSSQEDSVVVEVSPTKELPDALPITEVSKISDNQELKKDEPTHSSTDKEKESGNQKSAQSPDGKEDDTTHVVEKKVTKTELTKVGVEIIEAVKPQVESNENDIAKVETAEDKPETSSDRVNPLTAQLDKENSPESSKIEEPQTQPSTEDAQHAEQTQNGDAKSPVIETNVSSPSKNEVTPKIVDDPKTSVFEHDNAMSQSDEHKPSNLSKSPSADMTDKPLTNGDSVTDIENITHEDSETVNDKDIKDKNSNEPNLEEPKVTSPDAKPEQQIQNGDTDVPSTDRAPHEDTTAKIEKLLIETDDSQVSMKMMRGEVSAKTTYQRTSTGPIAISEVSPEGKFIMLENTSSGPNRRDVNLDAWKLKRIVDGKRDYIYNFRNFTLKSGKKVKILARGSASEAGLNDLVFREEDHWGVGSQVTTSLMNEKDEEKASHVQKTLYN